MIHFSGTHSFREQREPSKKVFKLSKEERLKAEKELRDTPSLEETLELLGEETFVILAP